MNNLIETSIRDSNYDFIRLVWDRIKDYCGGGEIMPVETVTKNQFAGYLDTYSGIDLWQIINGKGIRGIASRIQWGDTNWKSFTIRYKMPSGCETEYQKRTRALENKEWLFPVYTCQAYITMPRREGSLLSCAVAKTEDIFGVLDSHPTKPLENPADGVMFLPVWWSNFTDNIFIYEPEIYSF